MPEPFKNLFNPAMIGLTGQNLARANPNFDSKAFCDHACKGMEGLELKERSNQIRDALIVHLPGDFREACNTITAALHPVVDSELNDMQIDDRGIRGWAIMPIADFVAAKGLEDFDFSMDVLKQLTCRFSAEFAVRPFFIADQKKALKHAMDWAQDENHHARRLASEGSRPRLPWGLRLQGFVDDPTSLLPLLESLKDDPTEYVRRSVANNLNDIARDHPDVVADIAGKWMKGADKDRTRLVRHACRSLIKDGHKPTLKALGYGKPEISLDAFEIMSPQVNLGGALKFEISVTSKAKKSQPLIVDFLIHHRKANGSTTPKTFKWKILDLPAGKQLIMGKSHPMKPITTRQYYAGTHSVEIQINGESFGKKDFDFKL